MEKNLLLEVAQVQKFELCPSTKVDGLDTSLGKPLLEMVVSHIQKSCQRGQNDLFYLPHTFPYLFQKGRFDSVLDEILYFLGRFF